MAKLKDAYLTGLGIAALTYEKAEKITKDLIQKGELAKEKQQMFIHDLMRKAKKNSSEIEKVIKEKVEYLKEKGEPLKEKQDKIIKDLEVKAKTTGGIAEIKIKEAVREIIKKGKDAAEKQQKMFKELKGRVTKSDEEKVEEMLKKLDIPTKKDVDKIKKKLDELTKKIASSS